MKVEAREHSQKTNITDAHEVSIAHDKINVAMSYLRDNIYNDKILAVVRENITNAIDASKLHNVTEDVVVTLGQDTFFEEKQNFFTVQDFASGLSEEEIKNVFCGYFQSTKSSSNDLTGGFGIGAKASWCVGDLFYIISRQNGHEMTFLAYLEGDAAKVTKLSEHPTEEKSGLTIKVPVLQSDIHSWSSKARKFVERCGYEHITFIDYTSGRAHVIRAAMGESEVVLSNGVKLSRVNFENNYGNLIRMGGVTYGVSNNCSFLKELQSIKETIVFDFPIGSLSVSLNRESLEESASNSQFFEDTRKLLQELEDKAYGNKKTFSLSEFKHRLLFPEDIPFALKLDCFKVFEHTTRPTIKPIQVFEGENNNVVYCIPESANIDNWRGRVKRHLEKEGMTHNAFIFKGYITDLKQARPYIKENFSYLRANTLFQSEKKLGRGLAGKGSNYKFNCPSKDHVGSIESYLQYINARQPGDELDALLHKTVFIAKDEERIAPALGTKVSSPVVKEVLIREHGFNDSLDPKVIARIEELRKERQRGTRIAYLKDHIVEYNLVVNEERLENARLELLDKMKNIHDNYHLRDGLSGKIFKLSRYNKLLTREELRRVYHLK